MFLEEMFLEEIFLPVEWNKLSSGYKTSIENVTFILGAVYCVKPLKF